MKRFFTRIAYEAQMNVYEKNADGKLTEKNPPEFYAGLYRHLKAKAPERYFSIHIDHHGNLKEFASVCDIFETACWSSSFSPAMIPNLVRDMKEAKTAAGCKPVIFDSPPPESPYRRSAGRFPMYRAGLPKNCGRVSILPSFTILRGLFCIWGTAICLRSVRVSGR